MATFPFTVHKKLLSDFRIGEFLEEVISTEENKENIFSSLE